MNTAAKLTTYAAAVALAFGGAAAVGAAVGPLDVGGESHAAMNDATHDATTGAMNDAPRGLAVAAAGHRLVVDTTDIPADATTSFGFTIVDDRGGPVTGFDELHERRLHLIVLSRDLVGYHHLHPTMDPSGHWSVDLPPLHPGSHRVFVDFTPTGAANLTLGADLRVAGTVPHTVVPEPATTAQVDDYRVTLQGAPTAGDTELALTVERAGQLVTTEPYLGAAGHLVAIRRDDLAYLHVHPHDDAGPAVGFSAHFPTAGTYRLFFDFSHEGVVRTAAFTVVVPDGTHAAPSPTPSPSSSSSPTTTHAGGH